MEAIKTRTDIGSEEVSAYASLSCKHCGSSNLVRKGYSRTKRGRVQRLGCKDCGRKFALEEDGFHRMRHRPEVITLALDLYFKGLSLRKIADHLRQFHGLETSHVSVYKWIRKYITLMRQHVDKLMPEVGGVWHADEMMVNVDGDFKWLWNLMDYRTRFILAMCLTDRREIEDAQRLFAEAKRKAGKRPELIVTDGLWAYVDAYRKEFRTLRKPRAEHLRLARFEDKVN